jgi:adenylate cyclase class IV
MRNVEWKGELLDPTGAERICEELGAQRIGVLEQRDTYFRVPAGRLKRRECSGCPDEWIHYFRANDSSARNSDYSVYTPEEAAARFDLAALEPWVVVAKQRTLYVHGEVRVHLDQVENLGAFFELEALVNERQREAQAERALHDLLAALKPVLGDPVASSYSDLVAASRRSAFPLD